MHARTRRRFRIILAATLLSTGLGAAAAAVYDPAGIAPSMAIGGFCGLVLSTIEYALRTGMTGAFRRLPVPVLLLLRTLIYGVVAVVAVLFSELLLPMLGLPALPVGTDFRARRCSSANFMTRAVAGVHGRTADWR